MTWEEIIEIDPRVNMLYLAALEENIVDDYCANKRWYSSFKPNIVKLVGWGADKKELKTSEAYDIVYDKIYAALPNCRHESNLGCG